MLPIYDDYTRRKPSEPPEKEKQLAPPTKPKIIPPPPPPKPRLDPKLSPYAPPPPPQRPKNPQPPATPFQPPLPPRPPTRSAPAFVPPVPPRPPATRQAAPAAPPPVAVRKPAMPPQALSGPRQAHSGLAAPQPQPPPPLPPPLPSFRQPASELERRAAPEGANNTPAQEAEKKKRYTTITRQDWDGWHQWWAEQTWGVDSPQAELERADRWHRKTREEIGEEAFHRIFATEPDSPQGILMQAWAYDDAKEARRRELEAEAGEVVSGGQPEDDPQASGFNASIPQGEAAGGLDSHQGVEGWGANLAYAAGQKSATPGGGIANVHLPTPKPLDHGGVVPVKFPTNADQAALSDLKQRLQDAGSAGQQALWALEARRLAHTDLERRTALEGVMPLLSENPALGYEVLAAMAIQQPGVLPPFGSLETGSTDQDDILDAAEEGRAWLYYFGTSDKPISKSLFQHFLEGNGEAVILDGQDVLQFVQVQNAEERVKGYMSVGLNDPKNEAGRQLASMKEGDTIVVGDYWQGVINPEAIPRGDYGFAFNGATVDGRSYLTATRAGDTITLSGPVLFDLYDIYDFDEGATEQYLLQMNGMGRPFRSGANWVRWVEGTVRIEDGRIVDVNLEWFEADVTRDGISKRSLSE